MSNRAPWRVLLVPEGSGSPRLDVFVAEGVPGISRRQVQRMLSAGEITVSGRRVGKGIRLEEGARIELWAEPVIGKWSPRPCSTLSINIIYCDCDLIVIDKPAGIPSTPLSPQEERTLAGTLVARFPECGPIGRSSGDGGLVQRLDRDTSGLVLAARSPKIHDLLVRAQRNGEMEKKYVALVHRTEKELPARVDWKLVPAGPKNVKMRASMERCHPLESTGLRLVRDCGKTYLVEATIHRGQRHQIRVHLASAGFPIVGDPLYGKLENMDKVQRLQLHAAEIQLIHPTEGVPTHFRAPLPDDFEEK